jgi:WD40 repeat protein
LLHDVEKTSVDGDIELYLRTRLSKIVEERSQCDLPITWPGDEEINLSVKICSGLFIVAFIIVKHASHRLYDPEERLRTIISDLGSSVLEGESGLDMTYGNVFVQGFKEIGVGDTEFYANLRLVVGSIIVVFDPLSHVVLSAILGIKGSRVRAILSPLHSILIVPDTESHPIRICHKSLADYLQDKTRCTDARFYINSSDLHLELGFSAVFSHKDDLVAVGEAGIMEIFEAATGQRRATLRTNYNATSLSFSPDDDILVSGGRSKDPKIDVWDLQTGGHIGTLKGHIYGLRSIEFSPCGDMIATSSGDHTVQIWNMFSLDCRCFIESHSNQISNVCWSGSGSEVIFGSLDETVQVWSVSDKECSQTLTIHTGGSVYSVASSPDSTLIAAGFRNGIVKAFDAETGEVLHTISMNLRRIDSIRFLNQDQIMCMAAYDGKFGIWDLTKSEEVLTFECEGRGCAMSSDGTRIVSSQSYIVNIWQTDTPIQNQDVAQDIPIQNKHHHTKPMKMLKMIKSAFTFPHHKNHATTLQESQATFRHTDEVNCIPFSKDGQMVASGSMDGTVKIWDTSTGQCLTTFRGHRDRVYEVTLSPDPKLCASWGHDRVIRIWNVHTSNQVSTFRHSDHVHSMCFSLDGTQLVSVSTLEVKLSDVTTEDCLASMQVEPEKFTNISFGIDGYNIILRGSGDAKIQTLTLSLAHNPSHMDDSTTPLPQTPMVFVPVHDMVPPIFPDVSPSQYHYDWKSSWVMDSRNRQMLWTPPDSKGYCHGEKVVLVSHSGRVTMAYFQNVRTARLH